jgi:ketosteroid isomerase-like protein
MENREQRIIALASELYEITGRGDWDAAADRLTEDFFVTEAPGLPFAGVYRGKRALEVLYLKVTNTMDVTGFDIHQITAGGDWVVVILDIMARDADGSALRIPLTEAMRFRGEQCCEIKPYYFDPALPARAAAAKAMAQPSLT